MAFTRTGYANFAAFPATGSANVIYVDLSNGNEYLWVASEYVAYTGTLAGVRTGYQNAAWFAANPTFLLGKGQRVDLLQTGQYKLGDGVTQLSGLAFLGGASATPTIQQVLTAGQVATTTIETTGFIKTGGTAAQFLKADGSVDSASYLTGLTVGTSTITSGTNTRILYNNSGVLGEYLVTGTGTTAVLSTSPTFTTSVQLNGGGTGSVKMQLLSGDANLNAIYINQSTPSAINAALTSTNNSTTYLNGQVATQISVATNAVQYYNSFQTHYTGGVFSGTLSGEGVFDIVPGAAINLTANTEINMFQTKSYTWTWNTGAHSLQRFNVFKTPTMAFNAASTASFISNVSIENVTRGTNATFTTVTALHIPAAAFTNTTNAYSAYFAVPTGATNNWALGLTGDINFDTATGIINATTNTILRAGSTIRFNIGATTRGYISATGLSLQRGAVASEAYLHLGAGAAGTNQCPLKFTSGTNNTTAETGAMEYNGTNLFFTRTGTTREGVLTQSAVTTEVVVSDTTVTVNIGGVTYKLLARA